MSAPTRATRPAALRMAVLALGLLVSGCASIRRPPDAPAATPPPAEPPVQQPAPEPAEPETPPETPVEPPAEEPPLPPREHELPSSVLWVAGAEYRAAAIQTFRTATAELEDLAEVLEPGAWAVVLDVDETVLSNLGHEIERARAGRDFEREHWNAWIERRTATPVPGSLAFVERVRELGGVVALITNRDQDHCPQTEDNLRRQGVPYDVILCRPNGVGGDKGPRWQALRAGTAAAGLPPLEIVMAVGDNITDFPGLDQRLRHAPEEDLADFGEIYFVIPNPLYGSFDDLPVD